VPLRRVPERIDPPRDPAWITTPVVYGGHLPKHFGHFLLESLGRTWAYRPLGLSGVPFLHLRDRFHLHERELLEAVLRPHGADLLTLTEPTVLTSVLVPEQGIELGREYHPEMRAVYDTIRDEIVGPRTTVDETPLYLSRTKLPKDLRATLGERALEERLAARGVRIVHPQELTLADQLRTVAGARQVIGLTGTATHLTIFRALEGARTVAIGTRLPQDHQVHVDRLRGAEHRHVHAQYPIHPRAPGVLGGRELRVGPYRSFLVPALAERAILNNLKN
jgi:capsular polysaccharide biosynthesis protein